MFQLARIGDEEWDTIVQNSSQGNYFVSSEYLNSTLRGEDKFAVTKNKKIVALTVLDSHSGIDGCKSRYSSYQSLIYVDKNNLDYRQVILRMEIQQNLLPMLLDLDAHIHLTLHPSINDIRGFQFYAYENELKEFQVTPLYTGVVNFERYTNFNTYLDSIQANRRQEYRKLKDKNLPDEENQRDINSFVSIYEETFKRENISVSRDELDFITKIIQEIRKENSMLHFLTEDNIGKVATSFVGLSGNQAYYQFAGSLKNSGNVSYSSRLLALLIKRLMGQEIRSIDLVGMNSPKRSYFKTTFNPELHCYFDIRVRR